MAQVAPKLREVFGQLVTGKARWPLYLWGPVGTGKTRAALALTDFLAGRSEYYTMEKLCTAAMERDAWKRTLGDLCRADMVIVDDIGEREKVGDLYATTLKAVLDARDYRHNRAGIYTGNVSDLDLPRLLDDRLVSRLLCGTEFKLTGPDRRKE